MREFDTFLDLQEYSFELAAAVSKFLAVDPSDMRHSTFTKETGGCVILLETKEDLALSGISKPDTFELRATISDYLFLMDITNNSGGTTWVVHPELLPLIDTKREVTEK